MRKSRPARKRNLNINWGIVCLTKKSFTIDSIWYFKDQESKIRVVMEANNRVLNNQNPKVKMQVSVHYGVNPVDFTRQWI